MSDIYPLILQHIGTIVAGAVSLTALLALVWLKKHFVIWKVYDARQEAIDRRFADHEARLTTHGKQIAAVESIATAVKDALSNLPQREDLLVLEIGFEEVRGSLREMGANMQGIRGLVERQEAQTAQLQGHVLEIVKK